MSKVVLAMSGGVDSSAAASLLRQAKHDVVGVFMRHGQADDSPPTDGCGCGLSEASKKQGCCSAADAADARRVAESLDIPFYALNFEREFDSIIDDFCREYAAGRTPNPCVECNTRLKFGKLFEYADAVGAEFVASGHYARLEPADDGEVALRRGLDESKDQSYVLFGVRRDYLKRLLFPVGEYRKEDIRRIAAESGLRVAEKKDSQEICFVPDQDHARFVRARLGDYDASGEIVLSDGTVVGKHDGIEKFTIGQRKGLRVAFGEPRYVLRIEPETRRVVIGEREELACREFFAAKANWLTESLPAEKAFACNVKIRYRSRAYPARVTRLAESRFHVSFEEPAYGVAPGQAAVCYDGDRVLGGGWIE